MQKILWIIAFIFILGYGVGYAESIDPVLSEQMAQNPNQKFHVLAFFKDKLSPEKVVNELGIRGNEIRDIQQVVQIFKNKTQEQMFWISKQRAGIEGLCAHELLQAVSFYALPAAIMEVAKQQEIEKITLFTQENTKPDPYFLKRQYYEIKEVKITPIGEATENKVEYQPMPSREGEIDIDQIINILKKLYDFIKENQPVVNTSVDQASAVPSGINGWQQLAGWQEKHTGQYKIEYVNLFGITVIKIVLKIHFYYNGNYNGVGKYITCATSSIDELNVLWGYTLNATVKIPDSGIVNIGTAQNPIAAMKMFVHWAVHTIVQHQEGSVTYSIDGNGNVSAY